MTTNDDNRLGNNIRALRLAYGERQEDLAKAVNVSRTNIINYEKNGYGNPEIISAIAKRYMVSVYELKYCDFAGLKEINYDNEDFIKKIYIVFPTVSSEEALKDEKFKKAYSLHNKIYSELKANNIEAIVDLLDCLDLYDNVFYSNIEFKDGRFIIQNGDVIGAVGLNYLAIFSVLLFLERCFVVLTENTVLSKKVKSHVLELLKTYNENEDSYNEAEESIRELNEELDTIELMKIMKKIVGATGKWQDLLYYYCALQYIFNLIENEYEPNVNKMIGYEMMRSFSSCKNVYAMRYLKYI